MLGFGPFASSTCVLCYATDAMCVLGFPVWAFCWLLGCLLAALLYIGIMFLCWTPAPEAEGPGNGASGAAQGPEGQAQ